MLEILPGKGVFLVECATYSIFLLIQMIGKNVAMVPGWKVQCKASRIIGILIDKLYPPVNYCNSSTLKMVNFQWKAIFQTYLAGVYTNLGVVTVAGMLRYSH